MGYLALSRTRSLGLCESCHPWGPKRIRPAASATKAGLALEAKVELVLGTMEWDVGRRSQVLGYRSLRAEDSITKKSDGTSE